MAGVCVLTRSNVVIKVGFPTPPRNPASCRSFRFPGSDINISGHMRHASLIRYACSFPLAYASRKTMENSPLIERPRWVLVCWIFQAIWMLMTAFFYCLMWLVLLLVSKNPPAPNPDHRVFPISVWEAIFFVVYTLTWLVFPLVIIVIIVLQIRLRTMYTSSKHLYKREVAKMILATCVYISTMLLFIRQTANVPFIVIATAAWL
ncbi:hypothetical protein BU24DRAFT_161620 [Aaosphaeria arxii CBS 175.79]|uniref:Uncharacterized protein n=1 Tax=Aaosphaeria arxii CBS 175.79 TaxID=1450172 RepID=A0A6A5XZ11_9PLEO|nr:uncharacterized protein BU24DRAFT_161620 [Aaosphaeria arxii CBS 175.79]KAF2017870.1 hypothetical protein BU24DRAFT_161620 [Aaosphaeria arxii CBS 175.79]